MASNQKEERTEGKPSRIITIKITEKQYLKFDPDTKYARHIIDAAFKKDPELFPVSMSAGYKLNGHTPKSKKMGYRIRLIKIDGVTYRIYPHFIFSYMRGKTEDLSAPLFFCRWVPYWALAEVYGRNPMYYYRCYKSLSEKSIVGTTVQKETEIRHFSFLSLHFY